MDLLLLNDTKVGGAVSNLRGQRHRRARHRRCGRTRVNQLQHITGANARMGFAERLRPVFHRGDRRVEGHLFISVLAYHFVHTLRLQLKARGMNDSWNRLRQALNKQRRVTVIIQRRDGRVVHVRKATRPKPRQLTLGTILKLDSNPGRTHRVPV